MATTLVGIFDDYTQAQQAARELASLGINTSNINITRNDPKAGYTNYAGDSTGTSLGDKVAGFFDNLFGSDVDADDRGIYAESVRRGSTLVTVRAEDNLVDRAADVLNKYGTVNVDQRAAYYRQSGYQQFDATTPPYTDEQVNTERSAIANQGEIALPVIEEQLTVGKRAVQRGGVRVHQHVTERPVEETVRLREEQVNVERRPVNREVTQADIASGLRDQTIEVTQSAEEAVVSKGARVVEEVVVNKQVSEHDEVIRDTVRRTDVEVENITDTTTAKSKANKR